MKKQQFTEAENTILTEVYRRLFYFHKGDRETRLLLLETPSNVKTLKIKGYLKCSSTEIKSALNWYNLTEKGKDLFKIFKISFISDLENHRLFMQKSSLNFNRYVTKN